MIRANLLYRNLNNTIPYTNLWQELFDMFRVKRNLPIILYKHCKDQNFRMFIDRNTDVNKRIYEKEGIMIFQR